MDTSAPREHSASPALTPPPHHPPAADPADRPLSPWATVLLGLQHVLILYAGTAAVPLIVGGALGLPKDQIAALLNADLFAAGLVTLVQSLGVWKFGARLPVMMGVTFAAVGPLIAIGGARGGGLPDIYGAVIASGLLGILIAPLIGRISGLFPRVVTGTIIALIGLSLLGVGIHWCAGGQPTVQVFESGVARTLPNPDYGRLDHLLIAGLVLLTILALSRLRRSLITDAAVLLGLCVGTVLTAALGKLQLSGMDHAPWFAWVRPFAFGPPRFSLGAIVSMSIVMLITLVESMGALLALGEIAGRPLSRDDLTRGLRADGLGAVIGGIFNAFTYTSFSQNVGLVQMSGVTSPRVTAAGGVLMMLLGLFPKLAFVVASLPPYVLGGAGIVMFGMVAATGIRILASIDYARDRHSLLIIAVSLALGMIPTLSPSFFQHFPAWLQPLTHSGIVLGSTAAVVLNAALGGIRAPQTAP